MYTVEPQKNISSAREKWSEKHFLFWNVINQEMGKNKGAVAEVVGPRAFRGKCSLSSATPRCWVWQLRVESAGCVFRFAGDRVLVLVSLLQTPATEQTACACHYCLTVQTWQKAGLIQRRTGMRRRLDRFKQQLPSRTERGTVAHWQQLFEIM